MLKEDDFGVLFGMFSGSGKSGKNIKIELEKAFKKAFSAQKRRFVQLKKPAERPV